MKVTNPCEARHFLHIQTHLNTRKVAEEEMKNLNWRADAELMTAFAELAESRGRSMNSLLTELVTAAIRDHETAAVTVGAVRIGLLVDVHGVSCKEKLHAYSDAYRPVNASGEAFGRILCLECIKRGQS